MLHQYANRGARFGIYCLCVGLGLGVLAAFPTSAAPPEGSANKRKPRLEDKLRTLSKGSSTKEAELQGLAALPLDKLTPADRQKAAGVLESLSLFRELPTLALQADPEVHQFFLDHPEVAVSIWRAMKISKFELTETEPGRYSAADNNGTQGQIELLYRDKHNVLLICDGVVNSPILPGDFEAKTLLHLQSDFVRSSDDLIWSRNRLRMYVSFSSPTVEAAAKVVSPLGNLIIDRNLREVCLFVGMMSVAMAHQPGWVEHMARKLDGISKERQEALIQVTAQVFVAARKRELAKRKAEEEVTLDDVLRPVTASKSPPQTNP
jgi:hypothetical protein